MLDKNGKELKTGLIVKIENAFFKTDNGYYFIEHSPGNPSWCGADYCLKKICKNGKISTTKYNTAFWPLSAFTNDRFKNAQAREHNKQFATIEIQESINNEFVKQHFYDLIKEKEEMYKDYFWRFGENNHSTITTRKIIDFYKNLVSTL